MDQTTPNSLKPMEPFSCKAGNVGFRPAGAEDEAFLLELYAETRASEMAMVPWDETQKATFVRMQFMAQGEHYRAYYPGASHDIVLLNEEPVGRLYVAPVVDAILILDFLLVPAYRDRGIGTPLVQQLMEKAARQNVPLRINVETNNRSLNLYERLGFTHIETSDFHWLMEWRPA